MKIYLNMDLYLENYWTNIQNRKMFFQQIAQENAFNVSDASAWSKITSDALLSRKVFFPLLFYYIEFNMRV